MKNSSAQQLSFNFKKSAYDPMPEDITLDELLYVLKKHNDSALAYKYYFEQIKAKTKC